MQKLKEKIIFELLLLDHERKKEENYITLSYLFIVL